MDFTPDTGEFTEITHSLDRDLRDEADFDSTIVAKFRNANMSLEELDIAATALLGRRYIEEYLPGDRKGRSV